VAAAKQAYFEWMPVRPAIAGTTYRRLRFGKLTDLSLLDLRSFRSQQAGTASGSVDDPNRTITGRAQLDWLKAGLKSSDTTWRLVGNSVMISPFAIGSLSADLLKPLAKLLGLPQEGLALNPDQWDGYTDDRRELLAHLRSNAIRNTVFLTGDIHSGWACDLPADPATYPATGDSVAAELVCTSVTSDNLDDILNVPPRTGSVAVENAIKGANPHVKYLDFDSHGYSVLDVTPAGVRMDWFVLAERTSAASGSALATSFNVQAGTGKVTPAQGGLQ